MAAAAATARSRGPLHGGRIARHNACDKDAIGEGTMSRIFAATIVLGGVVLAASAASAQTFPAKPVSIVVTSAAGGAADATARALALHLSKRWNQQVVVENKPGANTQLAADYVAKSAPDGHTLLLGPDVTFTVNPHLYRKLSYDPVKDFEPITGLTVLHQSLVTHPSLPATSVGELIALAKAKPGALNYGTFGAGSAGHLNMEAFQLQSATKMTAVHYRGAAPAMTDVIAGHIQLMFVSFGSAVQSWEAGKLKMLAVGSPKRLPEYPKLPTVAESGLPGFEATSWFGLFAPGRTPRDIVNRIHADVRAVIDDRSFHDSFLAPQRMQSITSSPEDYAKLIHSDSRRWGKVIADAKLKIE
jgi:tripartite-type tricarboxylate transporter receptor subunit TctC